jgi:hypothetical protein
MPTLDDCTRLELKALARFATAAQIAEVRARIARQAADRENAERLALAEESLRCCRAVKARFDAIGADEVYHRLFEGLKSAARRSAHATNRWARFEAAAQRLEREATKALLAEHDRIMKEDAA